MMEAFDRRGAQIHPHGTRLWALEDLVHDGVTYVKEDWCYVPGSILMNPTPKAPPLVVLVGVEGAWPTTSFSVIDFSGISYVTADGEWTNSLPSGVQFKVIRDKSSTTNVTIIGEDGLERSLNPQFVKPVPTLRDLEGIFLRAGQAALKSGEGNWHRASLAAVVRALNVEVPE